jgi:hypothetical protein
LIFSRTEAENSPPRRFDAKDEWATHSLDDGAGSLLLLFLHHEHQVVPALPCQTAYINPDLPQRGSLKMVMQLFLSQFGFHANKPSNYFRSL